MTHKFIPFVLALFFAVGAAAQNVGVGTNAPGSKLTVSGSFAAPWATKSAAYTLTGSDYFVSLAGASANTTFTLPAALASGSGNFAGRQYVIKNATASYTLTVAASTSPSAELIDGAATITVLPGNTLTLISNGSTGATTTWNVVDMSSSSGAATGWSTTGNTGTTAGTNYLGTTDATNLQFKTNATQRMTLWNHATDALLQLNPTANTNWARITTNSSPLAFLTQGSDNTSVTPSLFINNAYTNSGTIVAGGIGIGTVTPAATLDIQSAQTATSATTYGVRLQQALTAHANSDVLTGLYINPTFTNGSYTSVSDNALVVGAGQVVLPNNSAGSAYKLYMAGTDLNHWIYSSGTSGNQMYFGEFGGAYNFTNTAGGNTITFANGAVSGVTTLNASSTITFSGIGGNGTSTLPVYINSSNQLTTTAPTSGTVGYWTASGNNIYNTNSSSIGIGFTSGTPASLLSNTTSNSLGTDGQGVAGTGLTWGINANGYSGVIYNSGTTAGYDGLQVKTAGTASSHHILDISTGAPGTTGTPVMVALGNGAVGIGNSSPGSNLLNVSSTATNGFGIVLSAETAAPYTSSGGSVSINGGPAYTGVNWGNSGGSVSLTAGNAYQTTGSGSGGNINLTAGGNYGSSNNPGNINFYTTVGTTVSQAMFIQGSTNDVGIGTTSPNALLTVNGSGSMWNSNVLTFYTDGGTTQKGYIGQYTSGSDLTLASTGGGNWLRLASNNIIAFLPNVTYSGNSLGSANPVANFNSTGLSIGNGSTGATHPLDVTGVINATTGYEVNGGAGSGYYLRGNGTNFVSSQIQASDITTAGGTTGSGTAGYVPVFTTGNAIGNSIMYQSGSNIGINTTTTYGGLSLVASGTASTNNIAWGGSSGGPYTSIYDDGNIHFWTDDATFYDSKSTGTSASWTWTAGQTNSNSASTGGTLWMTLTNSNLGIGTSPGNKLHVLSSGTSGISNTYAYGLTLTASQGSGSAAGAGIYFENVAATSGSRVIKLVNQADGTGGRGILEFSGVSDNAGTLNANIMGLDPVTGYVGVNTFSPNTNLTVNGSIGLWSSGKYLMYSDAGSTQKGYLAPGRNSDVTLAQTNGGWMRVCNTAQISFWSNGGGFTDDSPNGSFNGNWNSLSDARLKKSIQDTKLGIAQVMQIPVRQYRWKADDHEVAAGFIAQELYKVYPEAVTKGSDDDEILPGEGNVWMLDYGRLTPLLVKAIQDQQAEIESLKKENAQLSDIKAKYSEMSEMMKTMKASMENLQQIVGSKAQK